jgi:tripartite-type tricarboxylate transporter receptor subunit TctC
MSVATFSAFSATSAPAADYPNRPIRFIVPAGPGSAPDINMRMLATELSKQLGQQLVIDNRPGASGIIGMEMIVRAPPDGYTIGYGTSAGLVGNRSVVAALPYDPDKDLALIAQLLVGANLLAVTPSLPIKSVSELIEHAKSHPGKLSYGSSGAGSSLHLSGELFQLMTNTRMIHVPYKTSQQADTDLIGGRVQLMFENLAPAVPLVKGNRIRGLGVTGRKRSTAIPELPTIAEAGVPGYEFTTFTGLVAPVGVPKYIIAKLNAEINKAIALPALKEKFSANGYELVGGTPEQFAGVIKREAVKWADILKRSDAKVE